MRVRGFKFAAAPSGQKDWERDDVALIYSEVGAAAAGVFTRNRFKAAPVLVSMERVRKGGVRAVVANAGNANAVTGPGGLEDARTMTDLVARELDLDPEQVLVASTGVIGSRLNMVGIRNAVPRLVRSLDAAYWKRAARAIMTTDTVPKSAYREERIGDVRFGVAGIAKGAGMIRPDMATMLCFLVSDIRIEPAPLQEILHRAVEASFHRVNVDGDTSTNDTVFLLANGMAGNTPVEYPSREGDTVLRAVEEVCRDLARQIVMDAEGATKFVEIVVRGGRDEEEAKRAAHIVAESLLVKTAFFGEDPNWGRVLAALGRAGVECFPDRVDLFWGDICLVRDGECRGAATERAAAEASRKRSFRVVVDLKAGGSEYSVWTSDLSLEYVRINAEYRT